MDSYRFSTGIDDKNKPYELCAAQNVVKSHLIGIDFDCLEIDGDLCRFNANNIQTFAQV